MQNTELAFVKVHQMSQLIVYVLNRNVLWQIAEACAAHTTLACKVDLQFIIRAFSEKHASGRSFSLPIF